MIKKRFFLGLTLLLIMTASIRTAFAAQIILAWDANNETDLGGYKVYLTVAKNVSKSRLKSLWNGHQIG